MIALFTSISITHDCLETFLIYYEDVLLYSVYSIKCSVFGTAGRCATLVY